MRHRKALIARWTNLIPALDGEWDHWWLEGDGGLLLVTRDLAELLAAVESHYGKSLRIEVSRARLTEAGDSVPERGYKHVVADFGKDSALGWHD